MSDSQESRNRFEVKREIGDEPLLVRSGSFIQLPNLESNIVLPKRWAMPVSRITKGFYYLHLVKRGRFSLSTPYENAQIKRFDVPRGKKLILKLDHILAVSQSMFPKSKWRFKLANALTGQFRYFYLEGPGEVYLFGLGGVAIKKLNNETVQYNQASVLGWINDLKFTVTTKISCWDAFRVGENIASDQFSGSGHVITQSSTNPRLSKRFNGFDLIDCVQIFLGIR
jgi:uncharacterized protein (AIM24 family)